MTNYVRKSVDIVRKERVLNNVESFFQLDSQGIAQHLMSNCNAKKKCYTKKVIFFWEKSFREEILVSTKNQAAETCARV
jgi:hypothetical protein